MMVMMLIVTIRLWSNWCWCWRRIHYQ